MEGLTESNINEYVDVDVEGQIDLVAKYPGGWLEMSVRVDVVDVRSGECKDGHGAWFPTYDEELEVSLGEIMEGYDQLGILFEEWAKIYGGAQ